jgi:hypothetical protein
VTACFSPIGPQSWIVAEKLKKTLTVLCRRAAWDPGKDSGRQMAYRKWLRISGDLNGIPFALKGSYSNLEVCVLHRLTLILLTHQDIYATEPRLFWPQRTQNS